jgi:MmeI, C-terminal domain/MmeI, target recognition domain
MFMTWQKTVGGRIKSDPSVSSTLVWNTLPLPKSQAARKRIIDAGKGILSARNLHPDRTLADAYNPLAMDPLLVKAHEKVDREVDKAFGAPRKLTRSTDGGQNAVPGYTGHEIRTGPTAKADSKMRSSTTEHKRPLNCTNFGGQGRDRTGDLPLLGRGFSTRRNDCQLPCIAA